jgi:hypothetical protein
MKFEDAVSSCHVRSAIYRASNPDVKYAKNHVGCIEDRVPATDKLADDWKEWDPNDEYNLSLPAEM